MVHDFQEENLPDAESKLRNEFSSVDVDGSNNITVNGY
jgi:hypothetical protein